MVFYTDKIRFVIHDAGVGNPDRLTKGWSNSTRSFTEAIKQVESNLSNQL